MVCEFIAGVESKLADPKPTQYRYTNQYQYIIFVNDVVILYR